MMKIKRFTDYITDPFEYFKRGSSKYYTQEIEKLEEQREKILDRNIELNQYAKEHFEPIDKINGEKES